MTTFAELEQKRQIGDLTPAETKQWEALFNQDEYAFEQIFRTPVDGKAAVPNEANRRIIWQWAQGETEPITDIRVWFAKIFRENQSLARQLAWQDQKMLDPAYQAQLAKKNEKELRVRFLEVCKVHGVAEIEGNFQLWNSAGPDPVVTWFNSKPCIVLEDGDTLDLVPASTEQVDAWQREAQDKAFKQNQDRLREMAAKGDIKGLRAAAAAETQEKQLTAFELNRNYRMLAGFIQRGEKNLQPLPTHWNGKPLTSDVVKKGGVEIIKALAKTSGYERINALIWQIPDIEDFFTNAEQKLDALRPKLGEMRHFAI